jgi:hypothetical protein
LPSRPASPSKSALPGIPRGVIVSFGILTAAFAFFAWRSWRTWPDILVDFGHELYIPWRLSEGDVLYRDILFTMGPFSQYANALLFRVFGVSLTTLIRANLAVLAVIVTLLFWLFRRCGTVWSATFVSLFFLAVFAFGQVTIIGNYNYVCPYRHEVTHGLAFGLAELACLVRFAETNRTRWLLAAGVCLGLVALTKIEMLLPAIAVAAAALPLIGWNQPGDRSAEKRAPALSKISARSGVQRVARAAIRFGAAAAIPIVLAALALAVPLGWAGSFEALLVNGRLALDPALTTNSGFYRALAGWNAPAAGITAMLCGAAALLAAAGAGCLADRILGRYCRGRVVPIVLGLVAAVIGLVAVRPNLWSLLPASLPLVLTGVVLTIAARARSGRSLFSAELSLCLLAVYGLFLLPKILLAIGWGHYGFVLAMPGTLVLIHLAVHSVPAWLHARWNRGDCFRALAAGLLGACAFVQFYLWNRKCELKTLAFGEGDDQVLVDQRNDARALPTVQTLSFLRRTMGPDETLVVIPEGTTLNFQLRKRNPTEFLMVTPWEFDAHGGEGRFLDALARKRPNFIVFVQMDMTIHGRGNFGSPEYGQKIVEFVQANYDPVDSHSRSDPFGGAPFQAVVFQRRPGED